MPRQEDLQALPAVLDRPLPVLGRLPSGDELELIGGDPGSVEVDAGPFGPHLDPIQEQHGFVGTAFHFDAC